MSGRGQFHNTEKMGKVNAVEWEEHGHIDGDDTKSAYKKVRILDDSGTPISSFGGGTQYAANASTASPTGTLAMWQDGPTNIRSTSSTYPLPVNVVQSISSPVEFTGLLSLASGTEVKALATINNWPATQVISSLASGAHVNAHLQAGTNFIGGVSIFGAINLSQVTLNPSPNFIGLVTVGNTVTVSPHHVTNAGTFAVQNTAATPAGANYIGLATVDIGSIPTVTVDTHAVTQSGTWNVGLTHLTSLASGTEVKALATINNWPASQVISSLASGAHINAYLQAGSNFIGGVSIFGAINLSQVTLNPSPNYIGLVTIGNTVTVATHAVTQSGTWNVGITGLTSLASGTEVRSLATINNWPTSWVVSSLASGAYVRANLETGANFIGLVTVAAFPADTLVSNGGALGKGVLVQGVNGGVRKNINSDSDGNMVVNVSNFAVGQFGDGDGVAANLTSALAFAELFHYNGTSWDRARGDTTNGLDVDVTRVGGTVTVDATGQGDVPITLGGEEVTTNVKPLGTVGSGQNTVASAGTAEALASSTAIDSVTIKALSDNEGNIYVGDSGVDSTNGFVLAAGETVSLDIDNLADVYIDAGTTGDGVSFIYLT